MAGRGNQYPQCRQKQGSFRGIWYLLCLLPPISGSQDISETLGCFGCACSRPSPLETSIVHRPTSHIHPSQWASHVPRTTYLFMWNAAVAAPGRLTNP